MFATVEGFFRGWRRRLSRSEWGARHLGLARSEGTGEEPGLLLIQIDGLARGQLERALARGSMPFLRRLLQREGYRLHNFYPGLPSTTPAVQAELYYGVRAAVPGFGFYDRARQLFVTMYSPERAKEFEAKCAAQAEGLLAGGSSWSNIYTGGAGQMESHFCIATNGPADMWRTGKIRNIFVFIAMYFPATIRLVGQLFVEFFAAVSDAWRGIRRGETWWMELAMVLSRVFIGVGLRELLTIGVSVDLARGLRIVHVNFVGYDENAHRRGPGSFFAHWSLRGIDRAIRKIYRASQRSRRRDYDVWVFSDHGQERTRSLSLEHPGRIERVVGEYLGMPAPAPKRRGRDPSLQGSPWGTLGPGRGRRLNKARAHEQALADSSSPFIYASLGPVAHLYFRAPLDENRRRELAEKLRHDAGVPGVLWRGNDGRVHWLGERGEAVGAAEFESWLPQSSSAWRAEVARDLVGLATSEHAGDLMLVGLDADGTQWTFAPERGAHAGPGPEETRGFAMLPARTALPAGTEEFIRPGALRLAALNLVGRAPFAGRNITVTARKEFRVMTYNTHSCAGLDGRISPRRIARVIGSHRPDIVALQELDLGRRRSRAEDQAALIAKELGLHAAFVPTVTRGEEHYGHALLSYWPIEVIKRGRLPHDVKGWWQEPRSALWARVQVAGRPVNVITTHLGLGWRERILQMRALLGDDWIGAIPPGEPVLLCGDFNLVPASPPYILAMKQLRDVQQGRRRLRTFSSTRPLIRIDHIFMSAHFDVQHVEVPRTELTRVASDHLPLLADLTFRSAEDAAV